MNLLDIQSVNVDKRTNIRIVRLCIKYCLSSVCKSFVFDCMTKVNVGPSMSFAPLIPTIDRSYCAASPAGSVVKCLHTGSNTRLKREYNIVYTIIPVDTASVFKWIVFTTISKRAYKKISIG